MSLLVGTERESTRIHVFDSCSALQVVTFSARESQDNVVTKDIVGE